MEFKSKFAGINSHSIAHGRSLRPVVEGEELAIVLSASSYVDRGHAVVFHNYRDYSGEVFINMIKKNP